MRINLKNAGKIDAALAAVNGRAKRFVIQDAVDLGSYAKDAEEQLAKVLPKAAWQGARVKCVPAGPSSKSYGYSGKSTECTLERGAAGWLLIKCVEGSVSSISRRFCDVTLSAAQTLAVPLYASKRAAIEFVVTPAEDSLTNHERIALETHARKLAGVS